MGNNWGYIKHSVLMPLAGHLVQLEAGTKRYFQVIMFGVLYKVVLPFGSVLETVSSLK